MKIDPRVRWQGWLRVGWFCAVVLMVALPLASCRKQEGGGSVPSTGAEAAVVNLNSAGATFPYPLYSRWFATYGEQHEQVRINYQSIGSGGGIKQLQAGTVDFGASDAPLSDDEMKMMPHPVVHLPMVAGAVAVAYHLPGVPGGLKLTPETLAGIFLGEITRWNDRKLAALNPTLKLPNLPIAVAHRSDGSGTTYLFTSYLQAISNTWDAKVGSGKSVNWPVGIGGKGNEGVAGLLKSTPGAIGYVELAYATQNELAIAMLRNRAGQYVAPTTASTTAAAAGAVEAMKKDVRVSIVNAPGADAYPIAGFTYILLYKEQADRAKGAALVEFLRWAIRDGQQDAAPLMYAPLPDAVAALNAEALKGITSGGQPISTAQ